MAITYTLVSSPDKPSRRWRALFRQLNRRHFHFYGHPIHHHWWWVAQEKGGLLGFAGAKPYDAHSLWMGPSGVLPAARGQGIQLRLLEIREAWARDQGWQRCVSVVDADNWYSTNNFIRAGYLLGENTTPIDGLYLTKELT